MNIAILIPTLANGGAERVAAEISKYFSEKDHNIYIFTENRDKNEYDFKGKIIRLKYINDQCSQFNSWHGTVYGLTKRAKEVKKYKKKYNIDVSVSFMELYNIVNILSKVNDKIIVRVCTVLSSYKYREKIYNNKLIGFLYNKANCVVTISHYGMRDMITNYYVKKENINVIPNFVETYEENTSNEKWNYGNNVIICLARISFEKQQLLLIDIFLRVKNSIPAAKLLLVGNANQEYAARVKKKAKSVIHSDDIVFLEHISNIKYYLEHSKVCVLLSKVEGFGNATIEAMSVGVPVMCMDSPGASREVLAPHTRVRELGRIDYAEYGVLVPFVDEDMVDKEAEQRKDMICDAIVCMMNNQDMRELYSQKGKIRAGMFNKKRVGKMWEKLLTK